MHREWAELGWRRPMPTRGASEANPSRRRAYVSRIRRPASRRQTCGAQGELGLYQVQNRPEAGDIGQLSGINGVQFGLERALRPTKSLHFSASARIEPPPKMKTSAAISVVMNISHGTKDCRSMSGAKPSWPCSFSYVRRQRKTKSLPRAARPMSESPKSREKRL